MYSSYSWVCKNHCKLSRNFFAKKRFWKRPKLRKLLPLTRVEDFEGVIYRFVVAQNWLRWKNPVFFVKLYTTESSKWIQVNKRSCQFEIIEVSNDPEHKFAFWHIKKFVLPHKISSNGVSTQAPSIRHHGELFGWGTLIGQCLTIGEASTHGTLISNGWQWSKKPIVRANREPIVV